MQLVHAARRAMPCLSDCLSSYLKGIIDRKGTTLNWTTARGGEKRNIIPRRGFGGSRQCFSDPTEPKRVLMTTPGS